MQRRKFGREFKIEAVRLIKDRGVSVAQASRDLDVHENVLPCLAQPVAEQACARRRGGRHEGPGELPWVGSHLWRAVSGETCRPKASIVACIGSSG
jgi:hypothetical protein